MVAFSKGLTTFEPDKDNRILLDTYEMPALKY